MTQMTQKPIKLDMTPFILCHYVSRGHDTKLIFELKRDKMVAHATRVCCFCNFDIMKDK